MLINIDNLLKQGEGLTCEFKSSFNKGVVQTLCAFANTKGGSVVIGVDNEGVPVGITLGKETLQNWVNEIKQNTLPSIIVDVYEFEIKEKIFIVLAFDEFPIKPVSANGRYYRRIKNSNHQMSLSEVSNMYMKTFNSSWDYYEDPNHSLDDISMAKVDGFIKMINNFRKSTIQDDPLIVLKKYELIRNDKITNAAYLLFAKNEILATCIEIGKFIDQITIKDSITLSSDLFSEIENVMDFIIKHINKRYEFTGEIQRKEIWDYPLTALREIIVNMIIHRDYTHHGDSSIKIFDDKIEFFNPGYFPDHITKIKLINNDYTSDCRNKLIAKLFKDTGNMEKYGSGIGRVCKQFVEHGLKEPIFENFQHGVRVIVKLEKLPNKEEKLPNKKENYPIKEEKLPNKKENYPIKEEKLPKYFSCRRSHI